MTEPASKDTAFVIERVFNAPRDLVWRAWTEPELMARWSGPAGNTATFQHFGLRPGGFNHLKMQSGDSDPMYGRYEYINVEAPTLLRWRHMFADAEARPMRHPMAPDFPLVLLSTVTFEALDDKTRVRLTWVPVDATPEEVAMFAQARESMTGGWGGSFAHLDALLESIDSTFEASWTMAGKLVAERTADNVITLTRSFNAPRAAVYDAFVNPALITQWMTGPGTSWSMPVCENEPVPGGRIRYEWSSTCGQKMGVSGEFKAVEPGARLVHTELFDEDWTGGETTITTTFEDGENGGTIVRMSLSYLTAAAADGVWGSGMIAGIEAGYEKLLAAIS